MCEKFDVSLEKDGSPSIFLNEFDPKDKIAQNEKNPGGMWWPLCGHFFNETGAKLFCKRLNPKYIDGLIETKKNDKITSASVMVGKCKEDDTNLNECSGGCNTLKIGGSCERFNCSAGLGQKVRIKCVLEDGSLEKLSKTENSCKSMYKRKNSYCDSFYCILSYQLISII